MICPPRLPVRLEGYLSGGPTLNIVFKIMSWQAARVSAPVGRIAMREPRVTDRLEMLNDLIAVRGGIWDHDIYKSIHSRARLSAAKRDLLAHGIWAHTPRDEWTVQLARGSWPKNLSALVRGSKKVTPEGVLMDPAKLKLATNEIEGLIADLKTLRASASEPPTP